MIGFSSGDIKFHIFTEFSVPAIIHYNFGLNDKQFIVDPASNDLDGWFKSLISQIYSFLSLPPVAIYLPFGEIDKQFKLESLTLKEYLTVTLGFQIFNLPSHPTVAKYGYY